MKQVNRRLFLKGLGGASVAAPFLSSVAERSAKAQGIPVGPPPRRLIVMFTHYGCLTDHWFPQLSHGALMAADYESTNLAALAPHADKLLLPRGIRAMNQWSPDVTMGQGNDSHTQVVGSYFTCVPVTPNSDEAFSFEEGTKFLAMPIAPSLDHVCAKQLSPEGLPLYLRVSGQNDNPQMGISYSASETPYSGIGDPAVALANLTGLFRPGDALSPDSYQVARGKSLMDLVRSDLETLERFDMSQSDTQKLQDWKDLLSQTVNAHVSADCTADKAIEWGLTPASFADTSAAVGDISVKGPEGLDRADLFSNLAVLAALCDQNRVIFLKHPGNYVYRGLDLTTENHSISHRMFTPNAPDCSGNADAAIETIDRFNAEKFAYLVKQLDSIDEGEGTLLDNTAAVWFNEMSDGNAHNLNNMPIIQAGGCGGYFKTGQAVNVDDGTADLHRGNSSLLCGPDAELSPAPAGESGTPAEFGNAPINKYFCNLMNAIGVKADETGFPKEGGDNEVTHYGMYDDTRDFVGGGTKAPNITNPGGFEDLKAHS